MDRSIQDAGAYFSELQKVTARVSHRDVEQIATELFRAFVDGRNVFIFGNGGSAALASHMACDLGKGITFGTSEHQMRVSSLTDNLALITAWSNDVGYEVIFREQLRNTCRPGDVLFAISGSGNSPNVLCALEFGRQLGTLNLGITGFNGGKMKALCDVCFIVDSSNMQIIEDLHTASAHAIATILFNQIARVTPNERRVRKERTIF